MPLAQGLREAHHQPRAAAVEAPANGQPLDPEEMSQRLEEHSERYRTTPRPTLEAFINAPMGDDATATEVAELEWETDGVHYIFDKPREKQQGLADSTIHFFDHDCETPMSSFEQWRKHLEDLKARERRSDFTEEDEEVLRLHRRLIEQDPKLHARWEKAIFGKPIECYDFFDGFLSVAHSLVVGAGEGKGERFLRFTVTKGRKEWRERFNYDVGSYFSAMYRGLKELMGSKVDWKVERMGDGQPARSALRYPEFFARGKGNSRRQGQGQAELFAC